MAYSAPSTISTGDLCTAAIWNADVVANAIAIYAGAMSVTSQAIGDILYASSTTQFARIAAVATGQVLTSAGTGTVPAWSSNVDLGGTLDVTGATTLDSTLTVAGASTLNNTVAITHNGVLPVTLQRDTGTNGLGVGIEFKLGDSASASAGHSYGQVIVGIADNTDGGEDGNFFINLSNNGSMTEVLRIFGATGDVSIADSVDSGKLNVDKDADNACYFGKGFISSTATNMTADRAHFGHVDCENGTDYAIVQTAAGATTMNCKTGTALWFGINAGAIGNWNATGLRVGDSTGASYKLDVNGSLNKTSGTFSIDHPLPSMRDTHKLVHSFIEGPKADLIYRGTVTLVDGTATVDLDTAAGMSSGTWVLLCRDEQCYTSNETGWSPVRGSVSGSTLTIDCEENDCSDTISWLVVASRNDQHMYDTEWTNEAGYPIVEPLKVAPDPDPPL